MDRLERAKKILADTKKRLHDKNAEVDREAAQARIDHLEQHIKEAEERDREEAKAAKTKGK